MHVLSKLVREEDNLVDVSSNTYYENFSRYMLTCKAMEESKESKETVYSYTDYRKNPECIAKSKLRDLKATAKHLSTKSWRVHVHGNKPELIERIHRHFAQIQCAVQIQKIFRGFLAKTVYQLRGPGYRNLSLCVNESDFYTMDPLNEIDRRHIYSYVDAKGFVYGFDVFSLMNMFKRERKMVNPYTREEFPFANLMQVFSVYMKIMLLHKESCREKYIVIPKEIPGKKKVPETRPVETTTTATPPTATHPTATQPTATQQTATQPNTRVSYEVERRMSSIRELPVQRRIEELFMAIDRLGNYTQCQWFSDLSKYEYARFYAHYYRWWTRLPATTRDDICVCRSPFTDILNRSVHEAERWEYQEACLYTMEYMVYSGKTVESQQLGALHVLSHLTLVSHWARTALPWLFESMEGVYGRYR